MNIKGITIGQYISNPIIFGYWTKDSSSFVFTFKDNKPMKFNITNYHGNKSYAFWLYEESTCWLFKIGDNDIVVYKQDKYKTSIFQDKKSSFDYKGIENALIGKIGKELFEMKRLIVIQMI